MQIHDDIAHNRVEDFIRGDDNEALAGTEKVAQRRTKRSRPRLRESAVPVARMTSIRSVLRTL